jgi:hypothetical protein
LVKNQNAKKSMNLDIIVYGDITMRQCLYWLGAVVAIYMAIKMFKKMFFSRSEPMKHSIPFCLLKLRMERKDRPIFRPLSEMQQPSGINCVFL